MPDEKIERVSDFFKTNVEQRLIISYETDLLPGNITSRHPEGYQSGKFIKTVIILNT